MTGSRISQLDMTPVAPVEVLSGQDIRNTGFTTVGDVLRALPFNSGQSLTPTDSGTSFTPGVSTVNLRGLGNNQTLFLVNGRRAAPFASPGFDGLQTVFDLNSIPLAAIETVEIQKDGASAIYGSDAVGGVVNVKLRRNFQGLSASLGFGNYFETGGLMKEGSFVAGTSDERLSVVTVFNWYEQDAVFARDLEYSEDADKTSIAHEANPYYIEFDADGNEVSRGFDDPIADGAFDNRSVFGAPGWVWADSASLPVYRSPSDGYLSGYATLDDLEPYFLVPYWDYQDFNGLFPEVRRYSFYSSAQYDFSESIQAYAELSFARSESEVHAAPTLATTTENGLYPGTTLTMPGEISWEEQTDNGPVTQTADNPSNPYDEDITFLGRRILENGNRINNVTSDTPRIVLGLTGDLNPLGMDGWTWDAYALYTKNTVTNIGTGDIADYRLQQALYGLVPIEGGGYEWNENAPVEDRVFFNFWGDNSDMMDYLNVENPTTSEYEMWVYEGNVSGTILELPAGNLGFALGSEHRSERLADTVTDLNANGMLLGGGTGQTTAGSRDVTAIYAELAIPVIDSLEFQLAGRWEDYSDDGFESDVRPKIGFRFQPVDWMVFKGTYSESFKAPDLAYLYNAGVTTFTSTQYADPVTDTEGQIQVRTSGNPNLSPETADIFYLGLEFEPSDLVEGLTFGVSWFRIEQDNLLAQLSDIYDYGEILSRAASGEEPFDSLVVRNDANNQLLYVLDSYANLSKAKQTSIDLNANYRWEMDGLGQFNTYISSTYLHDYSVQTTAESDWDAYSSYLLPEWRHNAGVSWNRGDWSAAVFANYIGERERSVYDDDTEDGGSIYINYTVDRQITVNANVSYAGLWDSTVTVGVNNILNSEPPVDPMDHTGTTAGVNNLEPAFWWVRLQKDW